MIGIKLEYGVIGLWMGLGAAVVLQVLFNTLILILSDWQKAADDSIQRIIDEEREKLNAAHDS